MEEVPLVRRVVGRAGRICIAAVRCRQDSQPRSHSGGTMPWGEVAGLHPLRSAFRQMYSNIDLTVCVPYLVRRLQYSHWCVAWLWDS